MKIQSVAETIGQACKTRPALANILQGFEPLLSARRRAAESLAPRLAEQAALIASGSQNGCLLSQKLPDGLDPWLGEAAREILPALLAQPAIEPFSATLRSFFLETHNQAKREKLLRAILEDDAAKITALAKENGLTPEILNFAAAFIVSAVLRALAANLAPETFENWQKPTCPVCGKPPVIASLSKRPIAEPGEFLVPGGGKKYLHCDLCGTDWRFLRGVCPSCGTQGEDAMQILGEEERRHERIDWCKKCGSYLPCIDLREVAGNPDLDALALGLMHLDVIAAEKDLVPLKPTFWNMF